MDGGIASSNPESLAGILKTIFLFLENQKFTETCGMLIRESRGKLIPHIKEAQARLVVLRPSFTEIVRIAHADPKIPDADSQVQTDFPISNSDKSCVLEGSVYTMPETHPSTKHVSLFITESKCRANFEDGKVRTVSAPTLHLQACLCSKEDDVPRRLTKGDSIKKITQEDSIDKPTNGKERPTEGDLEERTAEEPTEGGNSICHASCTGVCSEMGSEDCILLNRAHEYVIIQQGCPYSCVGPCSEKHSIDTESDQGTDLVPIEIIHERPEEISDVITPLEATELVQSFPSEVQRSSKGSLSAGGIKKSDSDVQRGFGEVQRSSKGSLSANGSKRGDSDVQQGSTLSSGVQRSSKGSFSVDGIKRGQSDLRQGSRKSVETLPRSIETSDKRQSFTQTDETPVDHRSIETVELKDLKELGGREGETLSPKNTVEEILRTIENRVFSESREIVEEHAPIKPRAYSTSPTESLLKSPLIDGGGKEQPPPPFKEAPPKRETDFLCLDYPKLKKHLQEGDPEINRKLLRALRWRLTSANQKARNVIMKEYSKSDVLGLHGGSRSIAEEFLCPEKEKSHHHHLQEGMARFVNTMASLTLGREYLCKGDHFLANVLIPLLLQDGQKCSLNDVTRCHLLVTLQKLSLRNQMRKTMIFAGVPGYTVSFLLAKHNELSQYCLEYTAALFMNLCLHIEARDQLKLIPDKVIDLIFAFLDSDHDECLPYLNGTMYSVFIEPKIRTEAITRKLVVKIEEKIKGKSEDVRQQMEIIQNILNLDPSESYCSDCDCLDQDEEVEHLEPELDAYDLTDPNSDLVLEQFKKCDYYKVLGVYKLDCFRRPVTPLQKISFSTTCRNYYVDEPLEEEAEVEDRVEENKKKESKQKTSGPHPKKTKANNKTVDTLYKTDRPIHQESKMDSELNYLLAAKGASSARQSKTFRRSSPKPAKFKGRTELNAAELSSIYFQRKHFTEDFPCSYTRQCINIQDRRSFRADQAKAFNPCVFYKNYKICYNNDLPSFSSCTTQTNQSHQFQNRYRCDCFEEMKTLIDQLETDKQQCNSCCRNKPNLSSGLAAKLEEPETPVNVQPSYNELLHSLRRNLCVTEYCTSEANCTVHCECYNLVFQSRPKVTRTP